MMKILVGAPIHQTKDYSMERWLGNVAKLLKNYPADFLMVDSSPGLDYVEKVKKYCVKYGITKYKIKHLEINQEQGADERIGRSREIIRQEILSNNYDAWLTWEYDELVSANALDYMVNLMKSGDYMMVHLNAPGQIISEFDPNFGFTLIKSDCLKQYGFLLEYPNMPNSWHCGDSWFKKQVVENGGSYIETYGIDDTHKSDKTIIIPLKTKAIAIPWGKFHLDATWLGITTIKNPMDAWIYQEIIFKVKPNFILETGSFYGGSALFLASMLDICGINGEVYSIEIKKKKMPYHPKIHWLTGNSVDSSIVGIVLAAAQGKRGLVILDSDHSAQHVLKEIKNYWPIVAKGSYLIVEDTWMQIRDGGGSI